VLDDIVAFLWFLALGLIIGIPPMQFPIIILVLRFLEGMSHANARVSFGAIGERLLISPRFHRAHHGIRAAGQKSCNYGATFPFWDILFGTADFSRAYAETGDPSAPAAMVTGSWMAQQVAGFQRLGRALRRRRSAAVNG
jgi:sterol desaturase/sphingolipid hydroxylase (fatty acid hydroxylase superfamily)